MTQRHSIDGFVPRRNNVHSANEPNEEAANRFNKPLPLTRDRPLRRASDDPKGPSINRNDLDASLKGIDQPELDKKGRKRKDKRSKSKIRRIIKWVVIFLVVAILAIAGYFVYKAFNTGSQIFKGSLLDIVQNKPLKQDANGRSNILVLGTSQDDPGHDASYLTDSIMILSIDQKNKNAFMFSIPRDLEVKYGQACLSGMQGKINVFYQCVGGVSDNVDTEREALTKASSFFGELVGLDIQYGVNVNYTVMRELVNAVGGITVNIEGSGGAPGVMDSNFDWKCGVGDRKVSRAEVLRRCPPNGHFIEYPNGPANLDAEHALYLAQARGDVSPTYGLGRSNFDREINQQKIVKAIREKALSAGVLTDFGKVNGVLDALGNNLRTTFEANEIRTLVSLAKDIKDSDIQSISLIDEAEPILNGNAQPTAGKFNFGPLQAYIKRKLSSNPVIREEAKVIVLNGSGIVGVAQKEAEKLETDGFLISEVANAPAGTYEAVEIYQIGDGKTGTKAKLESLFGTKVKTTAPPTTVAEGTNFVVIIGKDRSAAQ
jgi:anionic cell wall polymer biosynthesis LytR-Cps2A-Psr (LCP) family protein